MGNLQTEGQKTNKATQSQQHCPPHYITSLAKILVSKTKEEDSLDGISETVFLKYVCNANKSLGEQLYKYFFKYGIKSSNTNTNDKTMLSNEAFIDGATQMLSLITDSDQLQFYIKVFANDGDTISYNAVFELIHTAYQVAQSAHPICCLPDNILSAVVKAAMHGKTSTTCKFLHTWMCHNCPRLVLWLHRYFTHTYAVAYRTIDNQTQEQEEDEETPVLECKSNSSCMNLHPALVWLLASTLPPLFVKNKANASASPPDVRQKANYVMKQLIVAHSPNHWTQLYNSNEHGLSVNRFEHHVFSYHGPTLLVLTTEDDHMFCVACDQEWRDSKHFWGGEDCRCLQLLPEYKVVESGAKLMYFNTTSRGFPSGFQIGIDSTNRSLTLDTDLSIVNYKRIPFKLCAMEVWGCGTSQAKEKQIDIRKREVKDVEKARKINVNTDWVDNPDRYLLEMASAQPTYALYDKATQDCASNT